MGLSFLIKPQLAQKQCKIVPCGRKYFAHRIYAESSDRFFQKSFFSVIFGGHLDETLATRIYALSSGTFCQKKFPHFFQPSLISA